jgi:magnesium chelatase family protein
MFSSVTTGAVFGIESYCMQVETDISDGLPSFTMVGYLSHEIREAGERVKTAIRNAGISIPASRIVVNFSPANIPKQGVVVDLPVAAGILCSLGVLNNEDVKGVLVAGELGLDGEVKPVRGVLPIVRTARDNGIHTCVLPVENVAEGAVFDDMKIVGVDTIRKMIRYLIEPVETRDKIIAPTKVDVKALFAEQGTKGGLDFADVHGQHAAKRALEISAAGFHNVLMIGPPGSGKSMLARRMPGILPPLTMKESMEVSTIYSIAGRIPQGTSLITNRPFIAPHHTITRSALTGGGMIPTPGVITLADHGIVFMDEFPEFGRENIDLLRQPLEDHEIQISRLTGVFTYPARFLLLAAMNPCPCGFYPDTNRCNCTEPDIKRYLGKISGPILDRIDMCVSTPQVEINELMAGSKEESSAVIASRVMDSRQRQEFRFRDTEFLFNADMDSRAVEKYCKLGSSEEKLLKNVFKKLDMSARTYHRVLKTARTIADLGGSENIKDNDIMEAVGYRMSDFMSRAQMEFDHRGPERTAREHAKPIRDISSHTWKEVRKYE